MAGIQVIKENKNKHCFQSIAEKDHRITLFHDRENQIGEK